MVTIKDCQQIINKKLAGLLLPGKPENLYDPIRYVVELEGKRIRPALVLMACNLFTDTIEDAINPAIAVELFHNFTLMHDDIMDQSDWRRNKPTVHKKWNVNVGIISGDAMLIKAYEYLALSPSASLPRIMEVFNKTALEVCEGQQYDMDFESQARVSLQEYLHMIKSKTAVLLAASLKIGALSGGSSDSDAGYLADFGENIGMAFQLQDDLLDVYGTLEQFGKQPGNDIASNKKTYLLLTAMDMAHGKLLDTLQYWIDQKIFNREEKVSQVISVFDALGIKKITEDRINLFYDLAMQSLEKVSGSNLRKQPLIQFAEMMMNRKK